MNSQDWKNVISTVAPGIATALGGPLAGIAVSALATKILGKPNATQEEVQAAVLAASPDDLAKIKLAEIDFQKVLAENDITLEQIASSDRDSARKREESVKDYTPMMLAIGITFGFFGVLGFMLINGKPLNGGDALLVMLGALGGAWGSVVAYYFGSSASSKQKTDAMTAAIKK